MAANEDLPPVGSTSAGNISWPHIEKAAVAVTRAPNAEVD